MLPIYANLIEPELILRQAVKEIQGGNLEAKQEIINLLNTTGSDSKRWEMIRDYMPGEGYYNSREYDVYITPGFTTSSSTEYRIGSAFTLEEKAPYLQEYVEQAPVDQFTISAATQLSFYYTSKGAYDKAEQLLLKTESTIWGANEPFLLQRVQLYVNQNKLDQAEERLWELKQNEEERIAKVNERETEMPNPLRYHQSEQWTKLQVDISIKRGDLPLALQQLEEGMESYRLFAEEHNENMKDQVFYDHEGEVTSPSIMSTDFYSLSSLKIQLERAIESGQMNLSVIKGKIKRSDGTPMANVGVFLRDEQNSNRSVMDSDPYQTRTGADGSYEIIGILPGSYQLGLGLSFQQVDGWTWPVDLDEWIDLKEGEEMNYNVTFQPLLNVIQPVNYETLTDQSLRFEWEQVEGAAYYELTLGIHHDSGSVSTPYQSNIKVNYIDMNVQELYSIRTGVSFSGDDGRDVIPETLLGFTNPEGKFSWSIKAFDAEGKLITRSIGYRLDEKNVGNLPFFYLKERSLSQADQLLLKGELEKAFVQYKKGHEANSNELHALRMIRRLGGYNLVQEHIDEQENLKYLKALAEMKLSRDDIYDLVRYYYDNSMWVEYNERYKIYQEYMRENNQTINEYIESLHAVALMRQGKLEEARKHFATIIPLDKRHRFVGHWLALEIYLETPINKVSELAKDYPERGSNSTEWSRMLNSIEEEHLVTQLAKDYLLKGLSYHVQGKSEEVEKYVDTDPEDIEAMNIRGQKVFLRALLEIR